MKSLKIALAALVGLVAVSCYNDFDTPAPQKLYTVDDMAAMGLTPISIKEVKEKFGPISNTGTNDNFSTTKTLKFGTRTSEEAKFDGFMEWPEASKYYIKGKVISSDRQGNIYKSLIFMMTVSGTGMTSRKSRYRAEALQRPLSRLPARPGFEADQEPVGLRASRRSLSG